MRLQGDSYSELSHARHLLLHRAAHGRYRSDRLHWHKLQKIYAELTAEEPRATVKAVLYKAAPGLSKE